MSSIKKNIAYKGLLTFSNYIIGFVTFPYITRVLGPEKFGEVNFVLNTVDYFLLFATMGIATIGTREIAAHRKSPEDVNATYSSLLGINVFFTLITLLIFFVSILLVPKFHEYKNLLVIGSAKILFTAFAVEWFFTGIENFRYITLRSLTIKVLYVASVFILVNEPRDYTLYFILTIGAVVVNALINFVYSWKFVRINVKELKSFKYLKQNIRLGVYTIMTSMYITFNVMYLGLVSSNEEVGYYSTAVKLYFIAVSLFSAFTAVMMPRMSSLISEKDLDGMQHYLDKSFRLVLLTAFPVIAVAIPFAPVIITILSGEGYANAVVPMQILMPALLLVWMSQVMALQGLIPLLKDNILLIASIIGGTLAIVINLLITRENGAIGSAVTLLVCEVAVTSFYIVTIRIRHIFKLPSYKSLLKGMLLALPYLLISLIGYYISPDYKGFFAVCLCCMCYALLINPIKLIRG